MQSGMLNKLRKDGSGRKSEYRNPKEIQNPNSPMTSKHPDDQGTFRVFNFRASDFLRISIFGFRISCLAIGTLLLACVAFTSCSPAPKEHVTLTYQIATESKEQQAVVR